MDSGTLLSRSCEPPSLSQRIVCESPAVLHQTAVRLVGINHGRGSLATARVNGSDMYYEDNGEGTPVLFIHGGFGGVESTLFPQRSVFTGILSPERFRTITYDRRNSSRSSYSMKAYRVEDLATDAAALLDYLNI